MPAINTANISKSENFDLYQNILNTLLEDKSLSQYPETTRFQLMDYLASHTNFRTLSKLDLDKLITIHDKFSTFYCTENLHSNTNQSISNSYSQFLKFSKALQSKEEFFHPSYTNHQTVIKTDCESILNTDPQTTQSITQLTAASIHGFLTGSVNAFTAIAFESAKNKGYDKKQLRLLKAGLDVFNSLTIASYASLAAYTENSQEPIEIILEKMWQSFVLSLAGSTGLYALSNGISYFAKSIESKFVKGALNAIPLAGNLLLLAKGGNNLKERAIMLGVNIASASIVSTAIQSGWHFFSKRGKTTQNTDLALELGSNRRENTSPFFDETSFFIRENSNHTTSHHYEVIGNASVEEGGYLPMGREPQYDNHGYLRPNHPIPITESATDTQSAFSLDNNTYSFPKLPPVPVVSPAIHQSTSSLDKNGYSHPKSPIPVINLTTQTPKPALPIRNQQFFSTGGLNVSVNNSDDNVYQSSKNSLK